MKKKPKQDPIFGIDALKELDEKAKARIKPFRKMRQHRGLRVKQSQSYHDMMRYIYAERDE